MAERLRVVLWKTETLQLGPRRPAIAVDTRWWCTLALGRDVVAHVRGGRVAAWLLGLVYERAYGDLTAGGVHAVWWVAEMVERGRRVPTDVEAFARAYGKWTDVDSRQRLWRVMKTYADRDSSWVRKHL